MLTLQHYCGLFPEIMMAIEFKNDTKFLKQLWRSIYNLVKDSVGIEWEKMVKNGQTTDKKWPEISLDLSAKVS